MTQMPAIQLENVSKTFGRRKKRVEAVRQLSLEIAPGQVFGFLGPNGAGKSSTIRMMMDLIRPSAGNILLYGRPVKNNPPLLQKVGALVEGAAFYDFLTGRKNLEILARTRGCYDAEQVQTLLAQVGLADRAAYWQGHAGRIRAKLLEGAWNARRGAFVESLGGEHLDASVLLMAEVGFIDPRDARFVATVDALEATLCDGPYMRRYEAADDFGLPETAFNICSFWRLDALARIGRRDEAQAIFEAMLAARNHLGLMSEDTHPVSGAMWGNFPQTYSMVGLINGAMRL